MPEPERFVDTRETLHDFTEEVLVACPACERCARVLPREPQPADRIGRRRRLVCGACGLIREWVENGEERDPRPYG